MSDDVSAVNVMQAGMAKSGNSWLYKIIQGIYEEAGLTHSSYITDDPVHDFARDWDLSLEAQAGVDVVDFTESGLFYRISSVYRRPIDDFEDYLDRAAHVWTHSPYVGEQRKAFEAFDALVYLIRDPRDRFLSLTDFMFTDYMERYFPHNFDSREEYLEEKLRAGLIDWVKHVASYLLAHDTGGVNVSVVFYENFVTSFQDELDTITDALGVSLDDESRRRIEERTTFTTMQQEEGEHVKKGRLGAWRDQLDRRKRRAARRIAGPMLDLLGYPVRATDPLHPAPSIPDETERSRIERAVLIGQAWYLPALISRGLDRVTDSVTRWTS